MKFNREIFYKRYKQEFGAITALQVKGLNRLLDGYERYYGWWDNIWQIASSLAQVKHETAHTFNPVVEGFYLGDPDKPGYYTGNTDRVRRFQKSLRYYPHFGMGDIQLTWEENYAEQDAYIRKFFPEIVTDFERRTNQTFDLIKHPEQVLDPWISFCIMTVGMHKGTFSDGHTLDRYFNGKVIDPFGAREIVNGDKNYKIKGTNVKIGTRISDETKAFEEILRASVVKELTPANVSDEIDLLRINDFSQSSGNPAPVKPAVILPQNPTEDSSGGELIPFDSQNDKSDRANPIPNSADNPKPEPNPNDQLPPVIAGDSPETPSRWCFNVEDWKPWVFGKLKLTWTSFTGVNFSQMVATAIAAMKSGEYWYVPLIIGGLFFLVSLIIAGVFSLVFLAIWYFNRREIKDYKTEELKARNNPGLFNFGLNIEKKI